MARQHNHLAGHGLETPTTIGVGIRVNGRITGEEDLHVEGRVEGAVVLSRTLHVGASGIVAADVEAQDVVVHGLIMGNVTANGCVTLHAGARVVGDISAPRFIVADGAAFRGRVAMGESSDARRSVASTAVAARPAARGAGSVRTSSSRPASSSAVLPRAAKAATERKAAENSQRQSAARDPASKQPDDDVTVVVRHPAVGEVEAGGRATVGDKSPQGAAPKKKKIAPVARIPKPGKRRVTRR